jgi:hypothetical protein
LNAKARRVRFDLWSEQGGWTMSLSRTGTTLVALGIVILLNPLGAIGQDEEEPPLGPDGVAPPLTDEQIGQAKQILAQDPDAQEILGKREFQVRDIGTWGGYDAEGNPVPITGATLRLALVEPAAFKMQYWPRTEPDPASATGYRRFQVEMAASNVRELLADIDLNTKEVVYLDPLGDAARVTPGDDYPTNPPSEVAG